MAHPRKTRLLALVSSTLLAVTAGMAVACAAPGPQTLAIVVETWDKNATSTQRIITIIATAFDKNGHYGTWTDPNDGAEKSYPMEIPAQSPWTHQFTTLPGETTVVSVKAKLFSTIGEYITCAVFVNGEQKGPTVEAIVEPYLNIPVENQQSMSGAAEVHCAATLNVPISN